MENQANSKNVILNYGLYYGGASILLSLITYALGMAAKPGIAVGILSFIIPIVLISLGIKKFRSDNEGFLTWGEAVKIGIGIAVLAGVMIMIFQYILENFIDPSILEQKVEYVREMYENLGMSEEIMEEQLEKVRNPNQLLNFAFGLLGMTFIGFVISAIAGAIMKNSREEQY